MNSLRKIHNSAFVFSLLLALVTGVIGFGLLSYGNQEWFRSAPVTAKREKAKKAKKPGNDQPDKALEFRRLQMQDENGVIPSDGIEKARQHVAQMKQVRPERLRARQAKVLKSPSPAVAGIEPGSWAWLGPGNIGGRIRSIVIHPTNPNNMWVGSVSGGIWRTTNAGGSWQPVNDFMPNLAISTMIINPINSNMMFAGTGELLSGYTSFKQGDGVYRSDDGGTTWNHLADTANANWHYVNRLAISPNGGTILAGTASGIWRSTNNGAVWAQETFVTASDIDFHPTDNQRAIAGGDGYAQFTTNGGQDWTAATFNPVINPHPTDPNKCCQYRRVELAYAPSNPSIVYASVNQNQSDTYVGELYRSTDGGQSYSRVSTTDFLQGQGWYDNIVWVNPQDANFVIVGGVWLWRSTDGGNSLTQISDGSNSAHADNHMIVAHPGFNNSTNRIAFFGNDGGIYRADNVATVSESTGWTELNNNLGITQFYGAAGNPTSGVIIGGTQDNSTLRYNGDTETWTIPTCCDGGFCAADPSDQNYFYGETQNLGLYRSSDGMQSVSQIYCNPQHCILNDNTIGSCNSSLSTGKCELGWGINDVNRDPVNFIAPFILDPLSSSALLVGGIRLWQSPNPKAAIPTWNVLKNPTADNSAISAIASSASTAAVKCVGHNNGDVYLTVNGTLSNPTWTRIDTALLPNRFVTRVVIDHTRSPQWIYAVFGGFAGDNIYRTTDLGITWTDVTGTGATGLPDVPVRTLVFHPDNPNLLYAGTEVGIFTSDDAGATWDLPQDGPANVSVDELFWMNRDLIAATHGRGMYRASGGTYVNCNWTGIQDGSYNRPFRTVTAAINAAVGYKTIWIRGCNYNETFTTNKRLDLRRWEVGVATIGAP